MTDQTRIPLPGETEPAGGSSIERAVETFGWGKLASPPVPASLKAPVSKTETVVVPPEPQLREPDAAPPPASRPAEVEAQLLAPGPIPVAAEPEPARMPSPDGGSHPVDREHLRRQGFIVPEGGVTETLEEFRIVKRQLLLHCTDLKRQGAAGKAQRVLICSPHPGEGKTYCAVNLALSIAAEKESEVLLVDADFAKP